MTRRKVCTSQFHLCGCHVPVGGQLVGPEFIDADFSGC